MWDWVSPFSSGQLKYIRHFPVNIIILGPILNQVKLSKQGTGDRVLQLRAYIALDNAGIVEIIFGFFQPAAGDIFMVRMYFYRERSMRLF